MIYIHAAGVHNCLPADEALDLKFELKALTGKSFRRIDRFIQLAIIGAHKAVSGFDVEPETALYLTSGQGDIPVFAQVRRQRYFQKMISKPVDFVNLSSNAAGFYVASHLKLRGTNLFLSNQSFPVQTALLLAQSELEQHRERAVLLGGVDEGWENQQLAKKLLGVAESVELGEGSNWLLLKSESAGSLASLYTNSLRMNLSQLKTEIENLEPYTSLAFSLKLPVALVSELMTVKKDLPRFDYESGCGYYETLPSYVFSRFVLEKPVTADRLFHIDSDGSSFMVMRLNMQSD